MKLLLIYLFSFLFLFVASCTKNDEDKAPEITSVVAEGNVYELRSSFTIIGIRFASDSSSLKVFLIDEERNQKQLSIASLSDTEITVFISEDIPLGKYSVVVKNIYGSDASTTVLTIENPTPIVSGITPIPFYGATEITIKGKFFGTKKNQVHVFLENEASKTKYAAVIEIVTDTAITARIATPIYENSLDVYVAVNEKESKKITVLNDTPVFLRLQEERVAKNATIEIIGKGFSKESKIVAEIYDKLREKIQEVETTFEDDTLLSFLLPLEVEKGEYLLGFQLERGESALNRLQLTVEELTIESIYPLSINKNDDITFSFNVPVDFSSLEFFIRNNKGFEYFLKNNGDGSANVYQKIPAGAYFVGFEKGAEKQLAAGISLTIDGMQITTVTPSDTVSGTMITIKGSGFSVNAAEQKVFFYQKGEKIDSTDILTTPAPTEKEVYFSLPHSLENEEYDIMLSHLLEDALFSGTYLVKTPKILSLSSEKTRKGTEIRILGSFFGENNLNNTLSLLSSSGTAIPVVVNEASESHFLFQVPSSMPDGEYQIEVTTRNFTDTFQTSLSVVTPVISKVETEDVFKNGLVSFTGSNLQFSNEETLVELENTSDPSRLDTCELFLYENEKIICRTSPNIMFGEYKIKYTIGSDVFLAPENVTVKEFEVETVTPLYAFPNGDTLKIVGKTLEGVSKITFTENNINETTTTREIYFVEGQKDTIKTLLLNTLSAGEYTIGVTSTNSFSEDIETSFSSLNILVPEVDSIKPNQISQGVTGIATIFGNHINKLLQDTYEIQTELVYLIDIDGAKTLLTTSGTMEGEKECIIPNTLVEGTYSLQVIFTSTNPDISEYIVEKQNFFVVQAP